jgi:Fe-S oxidoreductase
MQHLCCGRPLYDHGFLDQAKEYLNKVLHVLTDEIDAGTPIVFLEPSCCSVFRDELVNLFPENERARRLKDQTYLLSEFLEKKIPDYKAPQLKRKAIVQGHCHHKAIVRLYDEQATMGKMGLDYRVLNSGCCGMAGAFGFEAEKYEVSMQIGERALLPAVREAEPSTLVMADGFSCREQISQATDRHALHLAEVMKLAIDGYGPEDGDFRPERIFVEPRLAAQKRSQKRAGFAVLAGAAALTALWWISRRR